MIDDPCIRIRMARLALTDGWDEPIAYSVVIDGGSENRRRVLRQRALLEQLEQATQQPRFNFGGGVSSNKPGSRRPGNQQYADFIDGIHEQAVSLYKVVSLLPEDYVVPGDVRNVITALDHWCIRRDDEYLTQIRAIERHMHAWVRRSRIMLGYDVKEVMLADVSCHVCGGALVVAADASSDVRCVGYPTPGPDGMEPCGHVYPRDRWVDFLV